MSFDGYEHEVYIRKDKSPSSERQRSGFRNADSPRSSRYGSPSHERPDEPFIDQSRGSSRSKDARYPSDWDNRGYTSEGRKECNDRGKKSERTSKHHRYSPTTVDPAQKSRIRSTGHGSQSLSPVSRSGREKERSVSPGGSKTQWVGPHADVKRQSSKDGASEAFPGPEPKPINYYPKSRASRSGEEDASEHSKSWTGEPVVTRRHSLELTSDVERQLKLEKELSKLMMTTTSPREPPVKFSSRDIPAEPEKLIVVTTAVRHNSGHDSGRDDAGIRNVTEISSGSTTPGSKSPAINSDHESLSERESRASDEVLDLEKQKQHLLKLLQAMEDDGQEVDGSDLEIIDDDRRKQTSKDLKAAKISDALRNSTLSNLISIDTTQGYRKQMEALKNTDSPVVSSAAEKSHVARLPSSLHKHPLDLDEDVYEITSSPHETDNRPSTARQKSGTASCDRSKTTRKYRNKSNENLVELSSEDEDDRKLVYSPASHVSSDNLSLPDTSNSFNRMTLANDKPLHRLGAASLDLLSDEETFSESATCRIRRKSGTDCHHPCIIPNTPVITKGADCSTGPQEPRSCSEHRTRDVMSLPLPRFAYDLPMICRKSATSSPIVVKTSTPADSVRIENKMDEPPVSPGLIFSPDFSKSDSMVFADPMESAEIEPAKADLLKNR